MRSIFTAKKISLALIVIGWNFICHQTTEGNQGFTDRSNPGAEESTERANARSPDATHDSPSTESEISTEAGSSCTGGSCRPPLPAIKLIARPLPDPPAIPPPLPADSSKGEDVRCVDGQGIPKPKSGFSQILTKAKKAGAGKSCVKEMKKIACQESPWKDLNLQQRFSKILNLGQPYADKYGVDVKAMACIAATETQFLEPLVITYGACHSNQSSAQGLGQMTRSTLRAYMNKGFKSQIPPYNQPPFSQDAGALFDAMATSVPLQLEIMAYTMKDKKRKKSDYKMFYNYIGANQRNPRAVKRASAYAQASNNCLNCLKGPTGKIRPLNCLSIVDRTRRGFHLSSDDKIHQSFASRQRECKNTKNSSYQPLCR